MVKIFLIPLVIYLILIEPFLRWHSIKKIFTNLAAVKNAKIQHYVENILRYWGLVIYFLIGCWMLKIPFQKLGFQLPDFKSFFQQPLWLNVVIMLLVVGYFYYFYYLPIIKVRFHEATRVKAAKKISAVRYIAPSTKKEAIGWFLFSFNGFAEEIIYRGAVFFFIFYFFPTVNIMLVVLLSAVLDAWRFLPRLFVVANVIFTGLLYALLFMMFKSLYLVGAIHMLHYLKIFFFPFNKIILQEVSNDNKEEK